MISCTKHFCESADLVRLFDQLEGFANWVGEIKFIHCHCHICELVTLKGSRNLGTCQRFYQQAVGTHSEATVAKSPRPEVQRFLS